MLRPPTEIQAALQAFLSTASLTNAQDKYEWHLNGKAIKKLKTGMLYLTVFIPTQVVP